MLHNLLAVSNHDSKGGVVLWICQYNEFFLKFEYRIENFQWFIFHKEGGGGWAISLRCFEWRMLFRGQTTSKPSIQIAPSYGLRKCSGSPKRKPPTDEISVDEKSTFAR